MNSGTWNLYTAENKNYYNIYGGFSSSSYKGGKALDFWTKYLPNIASKLSNNRNSIMGHTGKVQSTFLSKIQNHINVCSPEKYTKHSSNTLLRLVYFSAEQTL